MPYPEKRRLNWIQVEPDTFEWLKLKANADGNSIGDHTGLLLDALAQDDEREESSGAETFWDWYYFIKRKRNEERVLQAAVIHLQDETEEGRDRLARLCEEAGLDMAEVLQRVGSDPFSAILAKKNDGTKFTRCMHWLPGYIQNQGGRVEVSELRRAALLEGFTPSMLDRVKGAIRDDQSLPEIVSDKPGKNWVWLIKEEAEKEQQQQDHLPNI